MTAQRKCSTEVALVAIDVAKAWNTVLMEKPDAKRQRFRVANIRAEHDRSRSLAQHPCSVGTVVARQLDQRIKDLGLPLLRCTVVLQRHLLRHRPPLFHRQPHRCLLAPLVPGTRYRSLTSHLEYFP